MKHSQIISFLPILLLTWFCSSCVTSDDFADTHRGNFEALWTVLDEHYCFFDYKQQAYGLDWDEVHERYRAQISDKMSSDALFQVLSNMTYELRDGHCNLSCASDVAYYTQWYENYPMNYYDSIANRYLGREGEFRTTSGLKYKVLRDNIGYVRCASFSNGIGDGNLHAIYDYLGTCDGLVVDVRSNSGGMLTSAQTLAGSFVNEPTVGGYMRHKTGKGHQDFSDPEPMMIRPLTGLRWQKPVVVLANRRTYSAANAFVMFVRALGIPVIGDTTGGGSGMPFSSELPEGWSVRFSACPMTDTAGQETEFGIVPDVHVDITEEDYQRSVDTILETAIDYLLAHK